MLTEFRNPFKIFSLVVLSIIFGLLISPVAKAQTPPAAKSYQYDSFVSTIRINQDTTFDVEEKQTLNYTGNFHTAFRNIPINKFDTISDITVIDGKTNQHLIYSQTRLQKEDPNSWGKFTYYKQSGYQYIEWYYNLSDATYTWIVGYKVRGGIEFDKTSDRLYWNVFSGFTVPIKQAQANIVLPGNFDLIDLLHYSYRTINKPIDQRTLPEDHSISFISVDFSPNEAFTIDINWPKGYVNRSAYWIDFVTIYYGYVSSLVIFLISLIILLIIWLFRHISKGTIVPEYQPPKNLRPALAEVITKERLTEKGFAATIIDLAVRGYIKIEEHKKSKLPVYILGGVITVITLAMIVSLYLNYVSSIGILLNSSFQISQNVVGFLLLAFIILVLISPSILKSLLTTNYILTSTKSFKDDPKLLDYEKKYLNLLFRSGNKFSTKELRDSDSTTKGEFYEEILKIKDAIYKETEVNTKAFEVDLIAKSERNTAWAVIVVAIFILLFAQLRLNIPLSQFEFSIVSILACIIGLGAYIKSTARLDKKGLILKEEWLGFKLYLEVAEKYRLQKLTPDLFEKYLPYAMIFGVEKKWAKAFDSLNMSPPSWYFGVYFRGAYGSSNPVSSFTPSSFSASFSSSFSSSFASSGAGGGGGGGGAGGGGGGGGGGAR